MLSLTALTLVASVWGLDKPHRGSAFLSAEPAEEVMGPNLNFSPLSTTMKCILNLTLQYIVIFTALGICRTVLDFQEVRHSSSALCTTLKHASETVFYAPMVCLMFVGFRMRVLQLTKGEGAPPEYVQFAMHSISYAILANTLLVLLVPVFTNTEVELEETGEVKTSTENPFGNTIMKVVFDAIRYLVVLGLYGGFACVLYGLFTFEPPAGVWDGPIPPVSPAVRCTALLTTAFFLIYLLHAISRTYSQYQGGNTSKSTFEKAMVCATDTLGMAPMLCALFLAARMRALQMDPIGGNPQRWAQNCFFLCTGAILTQTCVAVVVPLVLKGQAKKGKVEGDMDYDVGEPESWTAKGLTILRFLIMFSMYVAIIAVVCSVFTIQHPEGKELTPPLSPTMQCVLNLAFQYFLIYTLVWIIVTVQDFMGKIDFLESAKEAIEAAKSTVQFAPMLSVLFIATRMRALQMTKNQGAPQGWVQDGMYLATWSILIQFMMCLIMPFFTGHKFMADALDGSTSEEKNYRGTEADLRKTQHWIGAWAVTIVRYTALIALLGGITTVTVGVFMMTPETANGRGSIPLVTDGTLPIDVAQQPPGVNDIPGAKGAMKNVGETVGTGVDTVNDGAEVVTAPVAEVTGAA